MFGIARAATYYMGGGGAGSGEPPPPAEYSWDITTATTAYQGSCRVGENDNTATDIYFNSDGTKAYFLGDTNNRVYEYTLGTAWNIFTAFYSTFASVGTQETTPHGFSFSSDGTKMYVVGQTNDTVYQYTLSTAWLISSASYASKSVLISGQGETVPTGVEFSSDGTKMYVIGQTNDTVYQWTLSTAWDVSTASYASKSFSVGAQMTTPGGIRFADSGTKFYVINNANATTYQYTCSTAWDVSTASYASKSFSLSVQDSGFTGIFVKSDGTMIYSVSNTLDYAWASTMSTAFDISTATHAGTDSLRVGAQETTPQDLVFGDSGTKAYVIGSGGNRIWQYTLSTAWDINTMSYASKNIQTNAQETSPRAMALSSDGTKAYVLGNTNDTVYQYTLSTAWDISTATYATKSFSVTGQENAPNALVFKTDGTKMYVLGETADKVFQYSLSTAWDVSTASYDTVSHLFSAQSAVTYGLTFKPDGTRFWIASANMDRIYQYTCSTAWDVSTAAYDSKSLNILNVDSTVSGCTISTDGSKFYVVGQQIDRIVQYTLT